MTKLLFVDTETGGLEPGKHSLLQASFAVWEDEKIVDTLSFDIEEREYVVTKKALVINRINLGSDRGGISPTTAKHKIINFICEHFPGEKAVLVGQNIHFDIGFLTALFTKKDYEMVFSHRTIDTASILRFLQLAGVADFGGSSLSDAIKAFDITVPEDQRHTAFGDVMATVLVFNKLLEIGRKIGSSLI